MSQEWYVFKDGQQKGPFTREQLTQQAGSGMLVPADMVWTGGMEAWTRADQVEGLLPPAPVAPPPQPPPPAAPPPAGPPPGASPYQQGGGGFPGAPAGKQGKGLVTALAIILVGILAIGAYLLFFANGNGNGETAADPATPAPSAPVPAAPAATGSDALLGHYRAVDPEGLDEGVMYLGFHQDGRMITGMDFGEHGGGWFQTEYRFEERNGYFHLSVYDPEYDEWEDLEVMLEVLASGDVVLHDDEGPIQLERINQREFETIIAGMEEVDF